MDRGGDDDGDTRAAIAAERERTVAQIEGLTRDFDGIVASSELTSTDDEHDPEGATIAFERAQVSALRDQARRNLVDLDRALERLDAGDFGRCESCAGPIGAERLAALPGARLCVTCAAEGSPFRPG